MANLVTTGGYLQGTAGDDNLYAVGGDAKLYGSAGSDNIKGGAGNDILSGGKGADFLFGGKGDDVFFFNAANADNTVDKVFDFEGAGEAGGDHLVFWGFSANSTLSVVNSFHNANTGYTIFNYDVYDSVTGNHQYIQLTSLNGKALGAGDYSFYHSAAVPEV